MKKIVILLFLWSLTPCLSQSKQEQIIDTYLYNGAYKYHYTLQGWQDQIDLGLAQDSTLALLWQNKALPYWKTKKYDLALACYDQAVRYDRTNYLSRRGYLKCIFKKDYKGAIEDMELALSEFGYGYQSDHSYPFYIALSYLQLNAFEKAREVMEKDFERTIQRQGESWIHYLDLFYMGIIQYELRDYQKARSYFDKSLLEYPSFSDAKYYKGLCFLAENQVQQAEDIMREAKLNFEQGHSFNEGDSPYETYPYQVNWYMAKWTIPNYTE